ncbi:MAG: T9SS sorting signal type C domain-containing protein, partial [Flavobacterium sp.]
DPTPDDEEDNKPKGFIAAGQSFFIKGTATGAAVFNNGMRVAGDNNQFFRPASPEPISNWDLTGKHRVWLNMKGQTKGFNQLLVGYIENATNDWDIRFDGESFGGNQVTFYSLLDSKKLAIQGRALPFNNQDEVPLGYKTTLNGTLTISIDEYDGLFEGQDIYLEDKALNIVHDLKASAYSFTSAIGTFNQRFVLRYLPSAELSNPGHEQIANGLIVYQDEGKIMIKSQLEDLEQVTIYDLLGRNIFDKSGIGQNTFSIQNVVMNEQPLIVKVKLANGQVVNKKIVY